VRPLESANTPATGQFLPATSCTLWQDSTVRIASRLLMPSSDPGLVLRSVLEVCHAVAQAEANPMEAAGIEPRKISTGTPRCVLT
jgi:hypothetical protein